LLCVLALALVACGAEPRDSAEEFTGDERAVASAVEDLESAARDSNSEAVCTKLFAQRLLATLERQGTDCAEAVEDAFQDADAMELTVDKVTISGDTARAQVTSGVGGSKRTDTLELEKVGTAWRIASLAA
jgi:Putative lumazine-binding